MREALELILPWALSTAAYFRILSWDERRLAPDARLRAFPDATRAVSVVVFGPFAVAVHFARTRRGLRRASSAVLAFVGAMLVSMLVTTLVAMALDSAS